MPAKGKKQRTPPGMIESAILKALGIDKGTSQLRVKDLEKLSEKRIEGGWVKIPINGETIILNTGQTRSALSRLRVKAVFQELAERAGLGEIINKVNTKLAEEQKRQLRRVYNDLAREGYWDALLSQGLLKREELDLVARKIARKTKFEKLVEKVTRR